MKKEILKTHRSPTRDAVESCIDLSKGDKSITWKKAAKRYLSKISRW